MSGWWWAIGILGQAFFSSRFFVQWVASERARRSVVPRAFWVLSLLGGALLSAYAVARREPVFLVGQLAGLFVYSRNLVLASPRPMRQTSRPIGESVELEIR